MIASCIQKPQWGGKFQRAPVKGSALSMARQTVGAISSRGFTVSPTGCWNPLVEQRKLSRSPLLIRLRPSSLKVGMISPGLLFWKPLVNNLAQSFACGRIKQGFCQGFIPNTSAWMQQQNLSPLSKRRHWKCSDTVWMFNIYTTTSDCSGFAGRLRLLRQFQLSLKLVKSFQTLRQVLEQLHNK